MRYVFYAISLFFLGFATTWAYSVNYQTRGVVDRIKNIQLEIKNEEETLIMLEGEWAYLNRPDRLSKLTERFFHHLKLMPLSSDNYANIDVIKLKLPKELNSNLTDTVFNDLDSLKRAVK